MTLEGHPIGRGQSRAGTWIPEAQSCNQLPGPPRVGTVPGVQYTRVKSPPQDTWGSRSQELAANASSSALEACTKPQMVTLTTSICQALVYVCVPGSVLRTFKAVFLFPLLMPLGGKAEQVLKGRTVKTETGHGGLCISCFIYGVYSICKVLCEEHKVQSKVPALQELATTLHLNSRGGVRGALPATRWLSFIYFSAVMSGICHWNRPE